MAITDAIGGFFSAVALGIRAARDPAWSQRPQIIRDEHLERLKDYAQLSNRFQQAVDEGDDGEARRHSGLVRDVFLRELSARGNTVAHPQERRVPTVEIPLTELDAIFAELSGRRRDAELGEVGATIGTKG